MNEKPSQRPKVQAAIAAKLRIKVPQTTAAKPATPARPPEPSGRPPVPSGMEPVPSGMEPLSGRVLRQIRSGDIDEERLLPNQEKRRNDIAKKLERNAPRKRLVRVRASQRAHGRNRPRHRRGGTPN